MMVKRALWTTTLAAGEEPPSLARLAPATSAICLCGYRQGGRPDPSRTPGAP